MEYEKVIRKQLLITAVARYPLGNGRFVYIGAEVPEAPVHATFLENDGVMHVHEDRVEFFFPALLGLAAGPAMNLAKKAINAVAPKLVKAGSSLINAATAAVLGEGSVTSPEAETGEEGSGEPEQDFDYTMFDSRNYDLQPISEKRPDEPGIFFDGDTGKVELFLPALLGVAGPLIGAIGGLFQKKKRRPPPPPPPPVAPAGSGEPESVKETVAAAVRSAMAKERAKERKKAAAKRRREEEEEENDPEGED